MVHMPPNKACIRTVLYLPINVLVKGLDFMELLFVGLMTGRSIRGFSPCLKCL